MPTRCILCHGPMEAAPARFTLSLHDHPDAICRTCRNLSAELRPALRDDTTVRLVHAVTRSNVTRGSSLHFG